MKKMLGVLMVSAGLLSACQGQEKNAVVQTESAVVQAESNEEGLIQVRIAVEDEEINTVLKQFHEEGKNIIQVIPLDQKEITGYVDRVYDIIYVENN